MTKFGVCGSLVFALIATLLVVGAKSTGASIERIIGGKNASDGQFPHQVSIRDVSTISHFCAGAIISDNFVLTTANCMQGLHSIPSNVYLTVGSVVFSHHHGTRYNVSRIINHPEYNWQIIRDDISLIRTTEKIVFTNFVKAIAMPTGNIPDHSAATISGWGRHAVRI